MTTKPVFIAGNIYIGQATDALAAVAAYVADYPEPIRADRVLVTTLRRSALTAERSEIMAADEDCPGFGEAWVVELTTED